MILGIETSCDECSASVVQDGKVLSLVTYSQIKIHQPYGGVVPEIASRNHLETVNDMIDQAIAQANISCDDLSAIAVTNRPGLVGALLVGVSAAKALAYAKKKPLVPIHHLEGHAASVYLTEGSDPKPSPVLPSLLAIVSGGHTNLYVIPYRPEEWPESGLVQYCVGRSRDDAAGEAFDKIAKVLGFPYPGGAYLDQMAQGGDASRYSLPRALPQKGTLDFSFSGLKTASSQLIDRLRKEGDFEKKIPDICASVQAAIVNALVAKMQLAIQDHGCKSVSVVGGVAANSELRKQLTKNWKQMGLEQPPFFPKLKFCTDNAAMIALAGEYRFKKGNFLERAEYLTLNAIANPLE